MLKECRVEDIREQFAFLRCIKLNKLVDVAEVVCCGTTASPKYTDAIIRIVMLGSVCVYQRLDVRDDDS